MSEKVAGVVLAPEAPARGAVRLPDRLLPVLAVASVILALEIITRTDIIPQRFFPPPTIMFVTLVGRLGVPAFWVALWETLWSWAVSLAAAALIAVPLGIAMGSSRYLYMALRAVVEFLRPIPSVALIPAVILVIGVDVESKIFLAAFAAFWPILIQTIYGVQDVEPIAVETARSFGCGRLRRLFFVVLPSAAPYVATGLRIGSAVALIIVITMEIVVGIPGIGELIVRARQGANVEVAYALILAAGLLGWALNTAFAIAERRCLHWHPSQRKASR